MADLKIRSDVEQHLIQDIIPFWKACVTTKMVGILAGLVMI